jgi:hypothetical protein
VTAATDIRTAFGMAGCSTALVRSQLAVTPAQLARLLPSWSPVQALLQVPAPVLPPAKCQTHPLQFQLQQQPVLRWIAEGMKTPAFQMAGDCAASAEYHSAPG